MVRCSRNEVFQETLSGQCFKLRGYLLLNHHLSQDLQFLDPEILETNLSICGKFFLTEGTSFLGFFPFRISRFNGSSGSITNLSLFKDRPGDSCAKGLFGHGTLWLKKPTECRLKTLGRMEGSDLLELGGSCF